VCTSNHTITFCNTLTPHPTNPRVAVNYFTNWQSAGPPTYQSIELATHPVACPPKNGGVRSFKLETQFSSSVDDIRYRYSCYNPGGLGAVTTYNTPATDWDSGNTIVLASHNVKCPWGNVMTSFKLFRPSLTTVAYSYKCAPRSGLICSQRSTSWQGSSSANVALNRLIVSCSDNQMIQRWQMETSGRLWRINYTCCNV